MNTLSTLDQAGIKDMMEYYISDMNDLSNRIINTIGSEDPIDIQESSLNQSKLKRKSQEFNNFKEQYNIEEIRHFDPKAIIIQLKSSLHRKYFTTNAINQYLTKTENDEYSYFLNKGSWSLSELDRLTELSKKSLGDMSYKAIENINEKLISVFHEEEKHSTDGTQKLVIPEDAPVSQLTYEEKTELDQLSKIEEDEITKEQFERITYLSYRDAGYSDIYANAQLETHREATAKN